MYFKIIKHLDMKTNKNSKAPMVDKFVLVLAIAMAIFLIPNAYYGKNFTPDDKGFWVVIGFVVVGLGLFGWKLYDYLAKKREA